MGRATTPGNSVSMATNGYRLMMWHMILNSSSRLWAQTSRIPHSSLVVWPTAAPPKAPPPLVVKWTEAGLMLESSTDGGDEAFEDPEEPC